MAKFLDHHKMPAMTAEQKKAKAAQFKSTIESKKPDAYGVTMLNVFLAEGESWGYNEAPNAEAIVKQHEALGVKIKASDVVQVTPVV
jgi:hypothetical protein